MPDVLRSHGGSTRITAGNANFTLGSSVLSNAKVHGPTSLPSTVKPQTGGTGKVKGYVALKASPTNTPVSRKVLLFDETLNLILASTWSDPTTGYYEFRNVNILHKFTTFAFDYTGNYRATIADGLSAEAM